MGFPGLRIVVPWLPLGVGGAATDVVVVRLSVLAFVVRPRFLVWLSIGTTGSTTVPPWVSVGPLGVVGDSVGRSRGQSISVGLSGSLRVSPLSFCCSPWVSMGLSLSLCGCVWVFLDLPLVA